MISGLFFGCPPRQFHGLDTLKSGNELTGSLPTCSAHCGCTQRVFQPVCGSDNVTNYFSPCYAGCSSAIFELDAKNRSKISAFENCGCDGSAAGVGSVTNGYCKNECGSNMMYYLSILAFGKMFGAVGFAGNIVVCI